MQAPSAHLRVVRTALALVALAWSATLRADVAPLPPTACPAGTRAGSCHGGGYCTPVACNSSSDCAGGLACQQVAWCLATVECGGRGAPSTPVPHVMGSCAQGATCASGTCSTARRCVSPASAGLDTSGCSCRIGAGAPGATRWPWATLALGCALAARRRCSVVRAG